MTGLVAERNHRFGLVTGFSRRLRSPTVGLAQPRKPSLPVSVTAGGSYLLRHGLLGPNGRIFVLEEAFEAELKLWFRSVQRLVQANRRPKLAGLRRSPAFGKAQPPILTSRYAGKGTLSIISTQSPLLASTRAMLVARDRTVQLLLPYLKSRYANSYYFPVPVPAGHIDSFGSLTSTKPFIMIRRGAAPKNREVRKLPISLSGSREQAQPSR